MVKWKECRLGDLIEEIAMGPFGSNIKVECFVDKGVPVLNGSNLQGFRLNEATFNYVTPEKADSLGRANAFKGDVVITHRGTLGQIIYIPEDSKYERYVISQSQFRVRFKKEIDPQFIVYFFHTRVGQHLLLTNASQVGVPAIARPSTSFKELKATVPPFAEQKKIAGILSSLDEKIETNRKINARLEELAQALFKSWFIDFEPFGGQMPEDWEIKSLTQIAGYLNGLAMQKYPPINNHDKLPVLKIKELGEGRINDNSDFCSKANIGSDYIIENGDVIFSWSGTLLVKMWTGGQCGLNQHLFKVTSSKYPKWFYYYWTLYHNETFKRIAKDKAVTMGHIKREDLDKAIVFVPTLEIMNRLGYVMDPIFNQIVNTNIESARLAALRDTLLPKLMSGELIPE